MYLHFQQDFLILQEPTRVFFDPELTGTEISYHLQFNVKGRQYHLVMIRNEEGDWEITDKYGHGRIQDYELQFETAIKHRNKLIDNA
jgi:hypothetical protein